MEQIGHGFKNINLTNRNLIKTCRKCGHRPFIGSVLMDDNPRFMFVVYSATTGCDCEGINVWSACIKRALEKWNVQDCTNALEGEENEQN